MLKYLFVVNPNAGNNYSEKYWPVVEKQVQTLSFDYSTVFSEYPGHTIELVKDHKKDYDIIVAVGGDGTINEVANAINGSDKVLGVIPSGNGNDYAVNLGYTDELGHNLQMLKEAKTREVNIGLAEGDEKRYYLNIAEFGLTSLLAKYGKSQLKWLKGMSKYYLLGVKAIIVYNSIPAKIVIDDNPQIETKLTLGAIGFGFRYGGGFNVLPGNTPFHDDTGICIGGNLAKLRMFYLINKLKEGSHIDKKGFHIYRGKEMKVELKHKCYAAVDGELFNEHSTTLKFSLAPKKLKVVVSDQHVMS